MISEFLLQPNVYSTNGKATLLSLLEEYWLKVTPGQGKIFILSGFGNYNGGVRFYDLFKNHINRGGEVCAIFGGSTSQKLTSRELVKELLECGVKVTVLNRKRIMHAKCYGYKTDQDQCLVVTSGNFTGPGMSQNVEAAVGLSTAQVNNIHFDWDQLITSFNSQPWEIHEPVLSDLTSPDWKLLYKEQHNSSATIKKVDENTMLIQLGHIDTIRIMSDPGTVASKGSQYFWLSKDSFEFFPPLTIPNTRGVKPTYSALIKLRYIDLNIEEEARITFEAGNNFDFRLGTGKLRYTKIAQPGDIAAITRRAFGRYDLKIIKMGSVEHEHLKRYMINFIGNRGKKFGYIDNSIFDHVVYNINSVSGRLTETEA